MQRVRSAILGRHRVWIATCAIALLAIAPAAFGQAAKKAAPPAATPPASTLDRVRKTGSLRLGSAVQVSLKSAPEISGSNSLGCEKTPVTRTMTALGALLICIVVVFEG